MDVAHGGPNLFVRIRGDVFHEEVKQAGVALQQRQELQRAVAHIHLGSSSCGWGFGIRATSAPRKAESGDYRIRKLSAEEQTEERRECKRDTAQVSSSLRFYEGLAAELTTTFILALG